MRAGHALVTNDLVPLTPDRGGWLRPPGFPVVRMWTDEAEFFLGAVEELPLVHPKITKRRVGIGADGWVRSATSHNRWRVSS